MKRLAILGNSHAGCVRRAITQDPAMIDGMQVDFFAAPRGRMRDFGVIDGRLVPDSDRLRAHLAAIRAPVEGLVLADYDGFLLMGLRFELPLLNRAFSQAVCRAALLAEIERSVTWTLAQKIRQVSRAPVVAMHEPLVAKPTTTPDDRYARYHSYEDIVQWSQDIFVALDVAVLSQPEGSRIGGWATHPDFNISEDPTRPLDVKHMNARYGRGVLEAALARLSG